MKFEDFPERFARASRLAFALGAIFVIAWLLVARASVGNSMATYLAAWTLLLGIALGSAALLFLHRITRGQWGTDLAPWLTAQSRTLLLLAILAIPLLFQLPDLYPWASAGPTQEATNPSRWYLNTPFFCLREIALFLVWIALIRSRFLSAEVIRAQGADSREDANLATTRQAKAAAGLVLYLLSVTIFSVDWVMSLTAQWVSTVFGMLQAVSQVLCALAIAVVGTIGMRRGSGSERTEVMHDEGNLLFVLVLLWAYLAFMQYLIMWIEDLPRDISWYSPRILTSWRSLSLLVAVLHFAVPLPLLLLRRCKRDPFLLAIIGFILVLACIADSLWLVLPGLRPQGFSFGLGDLLVYLALAALWVGMLLRNLAGKTPSAFCATGIAGASLAS